MRRHKKRISSLVVIRALILFFPLGLYYLWNRRCRWSVPQKASVTAITLMCVLGVYMGTLSILPMQQTQRVYAANTQKQWQENLILLADPDGACYHVEGCIHVQNNALPIGLQAAYKMGIPGDARCNPPSYDARN